MTKIERERVWAERVDAYKASGLSKKSWCQENDVSTRPFYKWYRILSTTKTNKSKTKGRFMLAKPVLEVSPPQVFDTVISIKLGAVIVNVTEGFSENALTSVIRIVSNIC